MPIERGTKSAYRGLRHMDYFWGSTERMRDVRSRAERVARSYVPILIEGEPGCGKERLARYLNELHAGGGSSIRVFSDLGFPDALPLTLDKNVPETILLKRVHRLPVPMQEKVLGLLDSIWGAFPFLVSTSSESLERLAAAGRFLPELLHRLSVYRICVPPLRERREDIPDLFQTMLGEVSLELGAASKAPDADAIEA